MKMYFDFHEDWLIKNHKTNGGLHKKNIHPQIMKLSLLKSLCNDCKLIMIIWSTFKYHSIDKDGATTYSEIDIFG